MRRSGLVRLAIGVALALLLAPPFAKLVLRFVPPPMTPLMLARWIEGDRPVRTWMPLDRIAPSLPRLIVAGEDNGFCLQRFGVDNAALRAQVDAIEGDEDARGASTITMQLARNLFLPLSPRDRGLSLLSSVPACTAPRPPRAPTSTKARRI